MIVGFELKHKYGQLYKPSIEIRSIHCNMYNSKRISTSNARVIYTIHKLMQDLHPLCK